jgi:hypothetical protein
MSNTVEILNNFIETAKRSRKYPESSAAGFKVALRLFESELNDEEKQSIETLKENLDKIYNAVFEKNKTKYTASSLDVYRKRVSKLINDYLSYGADPTKFNSWSPLVRKTPVRKQKEPSATALAPKPSNDSSSTKDSDDRYGTRIEWPFDNDRKAILILPPDLSSNEAKTVKSIVDLRVMKGINDEK